MEQVVVLLVIAAISFINWLIKKSAEQREKRRRLAPPVIERQTQAPATPEPWRAPEEDLRKFMEALGMPVEEPPARENRWEPPTAEVFEAVTPPPLPVPVAVYQPPKITRPSAESLALARRLEARQDPISATEIGGSSHVRQMLRSRDGLRDSIILNEILSKPKSLQSF